MTGRLLAQLAHVADRDAEAIADTYAWPPRPPLTDEEHREFLRLRALSRRLAYMATERGCTAQGTDFVFGDVQ